MTLTQIPEFGFFVQNSRIGVKSKNERDMIKSELLVLHKSV